MKEVLSGATRTVLAHEARLALRGVADMAGPSTPARPWRIGAVLVVVAGIIGGISHLLLMDVGQLDPANPRVQVTVAINLAFLFVLMVSAALDSAAHALFARGDYDLLFSAPLSPRAVLLVRALGVFGFTVAKAGLYGVPMLVLLAISQGAHWLAGIPLILAMALSATAIAVGLAMAMVAALGIGRTRVAAQVAAALAGLLVLVMVQWEAIFGSGPKDALVAAYLAAPDALAPQVALAPARALMGDGIALLLLLGFSALLAGAMFLGLADHFVRNAVLAAGASTSTSRRARRSEASFGSSALAMMMLNERRIILRDPWLMSQILMQCIFLLPIAVVTVWRVMNGAHDAAALAPVLIVLCGQVAGGLTWIALSADDAAELAMTAPVSPGFRSRARLLTIAWLATVFAAPALMLVLLFDPWTGLVSLVGIGAAIICGIAVNLWHQPRPARSGLIRRRMKSPLSVTLMELAALTMVAVAAWPLLGGAYLQAAAGAALAALVMAALWLARRRAVV